MKKNILHKCPVCGSNLIVTTLECPTCHTKIEGHFYESKSKLFNLSEKDLQFVELFLKVRGNIKEVEKAMGVSYPTVRGILDRIIERMGYKVKGETPHIDSAEVLDKLEKGEISVEEAENLLRGEK